MKLFTYCISLTLNKRNNILPIVDFIKAVSEKDAIEKCTALPSNIKHILDGYTIAHSMAYRLPEHICPSNSENAFCYNVPENKITTLAINMEYTTPEFREDLRELLEKYWTKDLDKLY